MFSIRKESLNHHIRNVHSSENKIRVSCDECDMSFSSVSALNRHKSNQHLGLKNYQCNDCPAKFATKDNMVRHQQGDRHHFMYFCEKCKLTMLLRSRSARDRHAKLCSPTSTKIEDK